MAVVRQLWRRELSRKETRAVVDGLKLISRFTRARFLRNRALLGCRSIWSASLPEPLRVSALR